MMGTNDIYRQLAKNWDASKDPRLAHVLMKIPRDVPRDKLVYLVGVPDDRGVKNNHGRVGAARGPEVFRKYFGRLVAFDGAEHVCDLGDVPIQETIEKTHEGLAQWVEKIHTQNSDALVVVIGGGHDHAYGEILGLIRSRPNQRIGICNIDAHLDMRPVVDGVITSGTPFWRLWENFEEHIAYHLTYGVQKSAVARAHLAYAEQKRTKIIFAQEMFHRFQQEEVLGKELELLFSAADRVSLNIDLDAFSAIHAPGVSAPAVFGLTPIGVVKVLTRYMANPFLKTLGIYELNPEVDGPGDLTARLAAEMVYVFAEARVKAMAELASRSSVLS